MAWYEKRSAPAGWMTKTDVAKTLNVSRDTLQRMAKRGVIPAGTMFGNLRVWKRDDIEQFLENLETV